MKIRENSATSKSVSEDHRLHTFLTGVSRSFYATLLDQAGDRFAVGDDSGDVVGDAAGDAYLAGIEQRVHDRGDQVFVRDRLGQGLRNVAG